MGASSQVPAGSSLWATVYSGRRVVYPHPDGVHYPLAVRASVVLSIHSARRFHVDTQSGAVEITVWE